MTDTPSPSGRPTTPPNEPHFPQAKFCSINIPEKRSQLLYALRKDKIHTAFLQETNFCSDNIPKLHNHHFPTVYHATTDVSKSKGVSILLSKHWPLKVSEIKQDSNGRYLFIKGTLHNRPITLANLYAPNKRQVPFFRKHFIYLQNFIWEFLFWVETSM